MKRLDERTVKAFCALENNPDFRVIQEWLIESVTEQDKVVRSAESSILIYRAQGAIKILLEICEIANSPREVVKKMTMKTNGMNHFP